jgi:hypothetical protein
MERLFMTADDVAEVLGVSKRTAYTYIAQMEHIDRPRRATARGFQAWIRARTVDPETSGKGKRKAPARGLKIDLVDYHIPRRREGAG